MVGLADNRGEHAPTILQARKKAKGDFRRLGLCKGKAGYDQRERVGNEGPGVRQAGFGP